MRFRFIHVWLPALVLVCGSNAVAQVALSGQVELARLVDLSAQRLGLRVSYDESTLKGKVTLRQERALTDDELWKFTNRVLSEQGLTTIRAGDDDTIAVAKLSSAAATARIERLESADEPSERDTDKGKRVRTGFRRVMVPLRRASAKDVVAAAQLVLSKSGGSVSESEQAGFILIADLAPSVELALRVIEQLDGENGGAVVKQVPVRNLDAARLAATAKLLAEKRKAVGGRELRGEILASPGGGAVTLIAPGSLVESWEAIIAESDQREPVDRRTYTTGAFGLKEVASLIEQTVRTPAVTGGGNPASATDDRWRMVLDELTGTLIVTASQSQHEQIIELLERLAKVPMESRRPVRTFKVRNRTVREIQQVVEELLRSGVLEAQATAESSPAESLSAPVSSTGVQTSQRPFAPGGAPVPITSESGPTGTSQIVAPGLGRPSLGPKPDTQGIRRTGGNAALIVTSDEATNSLIALGEPRLIAQLEKLLPVLDVRQPQVMLEAMLVSMNDSQSLNFGIELEHLRVSGDAMVRLSSLFGLSTAAAAGGGTRSVGDGAGFTGTVLDPGDFSVVVRALQAINHGRSVSTPRILVNNNQQATFNSVLQQPFATTNASTTVSTTSFGGTQDAGTTISVKPQIAEGDHLVLTYSVSLSSFVGAASSANLPPPRQQNSVQSVATIPDGFTVVVGGLELNTDGNDVTQVPGVGDIPLVGELFKNRSKGFGRQRFYVFLRASVLRQTSFEDLKYLSEADTAAARVDDGWPEVTPRVIR